MWLEATIRKNVEGITNLIRSSRRCIAAEFLPISVQHFLPLPLLRLSQRSLFLEP